MNLYIMIRKASKGDIQRIIELLHQVNMVHHVLRPDLFKPFTAKYSMMELEALLDDEETTRANCAAIKETRDYTTAALRALGFEVLDSRANFVFARTPAMDGEALYMALKARGVLVRHFTKPEIAQFNRITIGTRQQMDILLDAIRAILEERK